jgi:hypothetical protein
MQQSIYHKLGLALSALLAVPMVMSSNPANAAIVHHYDRSSAYSSIEMCRPGSSGESLADQIPATPAIGCVREQVLGDIRIDVSWADGASGSEIWSSDAGNGNPGVTVAAGTHSARLSQTGDTFSKPWTLSNISTTSGILEVVMTALGAPDMGFDTDNGSAPFHGDAGFPLYLDATSAWNGDLDVYYDRWNNWNGTTDIFHRMTMEFADATPVVADADMVFYQDTDEVPVPAAALLVMTGLLGIAATRKRRPAAR